VGAREGVRGGNLKTPTLKKLGEEGKRSLKRGVVIVIPAQAGI